MDTGFTLVVKFGERGLARRCSRDYNREELINYLATNWDGISKDDIFLFYDLLGTGELDLADDEDMVTMFRLMEEMQTRRVHIYARSLSGVAGGLVGGGADNVGKEVVVYNDSVVEAANEGSRGGSPSCSQIAK